MTKPTPAKVAEALKKASAEAYKAGMLRAAEIAEARDPDKPTNYLHRRENIPAAIRAEAEGER
jgi:hypothetical protein